MSDNPERDELARLYAEHWGEDLTSLHDKDYELFDRILAAGYRRTQPAPYEGDDAEIRDAHALAPKVLPEYVASVVQQAMSGPFNYDSRRLLAREILRLPRPAADDTTPDNWPGVRVDHDDEAHASYITIGPERPVTRTAVDKRGINVDFGADGRVVGVEVLRTPVPVDDSSVERVARTIFTRQAPVGEIWENQHPPLRAAYRADARAAVRAMSGEGQ